MEDDPLLFEAVTVERQPLDPDWFTTADSPWTVQAGDLYEIRAGSAFDFQS